MLNIQTPSAPDISQAEAHELLKPEDIIGKFLYLTGNAFWPGRPTSNGISRWSWQELPSVEFELLLLEITRGGFRAELRRDQNGDFVIPDVCSFRVTEIPVPLSRYAWDKFFVEAVMRSGVAYIPLPLPSSNEV